MNNKIGSVKMMGFLDDFDEEGRLTVFKFGYLSNDAICVLLKMRDREEISGGDIKSLERMLGVLNDVYEGMKVFGSTGVPGSFSFAGRGVSNLFIYQQMVKLFFRYSDRSFEEVGTDVAMSRTNIDDLIKHLLPGGARLADKKKEEKIEQVKEFLSLVSRAYQNVFMNEMGM